MNIQPRNLVTKDFFERLTFGGILGSLVVGILFIVFHAALARRTRRPQVETVARHPPTRCCR